MDGTLLSLWQYAEGRSLEEISNGFNTDFATPKIIRAALACLAEAGLLERNFESSEVASLEKPSATQSPLPAPPTVTVSALIVNYKSFEWLKECIASLLAQTYPDIRIIVVDNGSYDGALQWLETNHPAIQHLQINSSTSLSQAINTGVALAAPENYLLLLNPDVRLDIDAVAQMVSVAQSDLDCAAVAPKLYFSWAPAFLNGLGNHVGSLSWGTDNAIGHLDLGQFSSYHQLPSACFAAALITPKAWHAIGPLDEGFPMYYEDVEWCYRARLLGFKVLAAPNAVIFHAFGGSHGSTGISEVITPPKLANVVYGRQRFVIKLLNQYLVRFLRNYAIEDFLNFLRYLFSAKFSNARAYLRGWGKVIRKLPAILAERRRLQDKRLISDEDLFKIQRNIPMPLVWNGLPELTWDLIIDHYYPLIVGKKTRLMPELSTQDCPNLLVISTGETSVSSLLVRQLIQELAGKVYITLAVPISLANSAPEIPEPAEFINDYFQQINYVPNRPKSLHLLVDNCDIAIIPGTLVSNIPLLEHTESRLVILLPSQGTRSMEASELDPMLSLGDFFISPAPERPAWLEALKARGRSNIPVEYDIETITRYCLEGRIAPDRDPRLAYPVKPPPEPAQRLALMIYIWRKQGFRTMLHRTRRYIFQHILHSSE